MAHLIDGRSLAAKIREQVKNAVKKTTKTPRLAVVLVGDDPASMLYVSLKEKTAEEVGVAFEKQIFAKDASEENILAHIRSLNERKDVDAILIQLPLPEYLDTNRIIKEINPAKDVDGFHPANIQSLKENADATPPVLVEVILKLIETTSVSLRDANVVILANSTVFADPLSSALQNHNAHVEVCMRPFSVAEVTEKTKNADIVITALGDPHFVTSDMVKDNAVVIDVGTTRVNEKILGDVKADDFENRNIWLTPVPGGVGPMTVAIMFKRTLELAEKR